MWRLTESEDDGSGNVCGRKLRHVVIHRGSGLDVSFETCLRELCTCADEARRDDGGADIFVICLVPNKEAR